MFKNVVKLYVKIFNDVQFNHYFDFPLSLATAVPADFLFYLLPLTFLTFCLFLFRLQSNLALDGTVATDLGQMVGSLTSDNELWLAMVLRRESVQNLTSAVMNKNVICCNVSCSVILYGTYLLIAFYFSLSN